MAELNPLENPEFGASLNEQVHIMLTKLNTFAMLANVTVQSPNAEGSNPNPRTFHPKATVTPPIAVACPSEAGTQTARVPNPRRTKRHVIYSGNHRKSNATYKGRQIFVGSHLTFGAAAGPQAPANAVPNGLEGSSQDRAGPSEKNVEGQSDDEGDTEYDVDEETIEYRVQAVSSNEQYGGEQKFIQSTIHFG